MPSRKSADQRVVFLLLPDVHVLDLAGPLQVFYEANRLGGRYRPSFAGVEPEVRSAQGLVLARLEEPPVLGEGDLAVVPGIYSGRLDEIGGPREIDGLPRIAEWLRAGFEAGARICSVCSGAHVLGRAGLLDGRSCTTHWKVVPRLRREFPGARVLDNRLFVEDGRILTSAGVASGIDLALWIVEGDHGPVVAARVAREIVVYLRRDGASRQRSVYLDYRTHLHPGIHRVQDFLVAHPEERPTLDRLGEIAGMSARNLTRVFRQATGITLKTFATRLKLEVAANLLHSPQLTIEAVASRCGFQDARQLRRLWKQEYGMTPSEWKEKRGSEDATRTDIDDLRDATGGGAGSRSAGRPERERERPAAERRRVGGGEQRAGRGGGT